MVEGISIDEEFLTVALEKATKFFIYGVLPEVLSKWYSRLPNYQVTPSQSSTSSETTNVEKEVWCYCKSDEDGDDLL